MALGYHAAWTGYSPARRRVVPVRQFGAGAEKYDVPGDLVENLLIRVPLNTRRWWAALAFASLAALAGCEGSGLFGNIGETGSPSAQGSGDAGNDTALATPRPGVRPDPPKDGNVAARIVVGGSEAEVTRILGEPTAVRNEPPAMVWHYAASRCKLDVFFYFDIRNKDFRALSYKFYPDPLSLEREQACLSSIRSSASR